MKGGVGRFLIVVFLMFIGFFILISLASGGSIGDGVVNFFGLIINAIAGIWNFGG